MLVNYIDFNVSCKARRTSGGLGTRPAESGPKVPCNLAFERTRRFEPFFRADSPPEDNPQRSPIKRGRPFEEKYLAGEFFGFRSEGRTRTDVAKPMSRRPEVRRFQGNRFVRGQDVHPENSRRQDGVRIDSDVGGGISQFVSPAAAMNHFPRNRVRIAQLAACARHITLIKQV